MKQFNKFFYIERFSIIDLICIGIIGPFLLIEYGVLVWLLFLVVSSIASAKLTLIFAR